jgi:histidine triad (HIT) family protein
MDCLFCSIASGKIPTIKVLEDDNHLAFLDINPSSPGHTVIIPKKHYSKLEEMPKSEVESIFGFISELSKFVMKAMETEYCNIGINNGKLAGQEVPHVHFHIIPRFEGDGGTSVQGIVRMPVKKEDLPKIAEKIKGALGGAEKSCSLTEEKKEDKKPEITGVAKTGSAEAKKPEKAVDLPKKKPSKSSSREWQEFNLKHQDDCENLDDARNV